VVTYRVEPKLRVRRLFFGDAKDRRSETLWLGTLSELGASRIQVNLDLSTEHVVAIVGKRGSGKSFTLGVFLEGLARRNADSILSRLDPSHAVLLLDSLNIYWPSINPVPSEPDGKKGPIRDQQELLSRWKLSPEPIDAQLWAPAGFEPDFLKDEYRVFTLAVGSFSSEDWGYLFGADTARDPIGQAIAEAHQKVTVSGWRPSPTGSGVSATTEPAVVDFVECLQQDHEIQRHFASETVRAAIQRFRSLLRYPLFARVGTELSDMLNPGAAAVLMVGAVPDDIRGVLVSTLARRLQSQRAEVSGHAKREALFGASIPRGGEIPPTWLMIDEAQNFLPSGRATSATEALLRFVREGRNYGLSFLVTSQQPAAVDSRIMAQVDALLAHQLVTAKDVAVVVDNLKSPLPRSISHGGRPVRFTEALAQLDAGQAVISAPELSRTCFASIRPRVTMHGGFEA
jgi:hypothetical protein